MSRNFGPKSTAGNPVAKLYETVIEDVIANIRESFLDDGVDDQVLQELKQSWETKLHQTKAVDCPTIEDKAMSQRTAPLFRYTLPSTQGNPTAVVPGGRSVVYQIPAGHTQQVQLSSSSQQATIALPSGIYQQGANIIKVPAGQTVNQQVFRSYQPLVVQGQSVQLAQQVGSSTTANKIVLTPRNPSQTNIVTTTAQKGESSSGSSQIPSAIIQVDGTSDEITEDENCFIKYTKLNTKKSKQNNSVIKCNKIKKNRKVEIRFLVDGVDDSSSDDEDDDEDESDMDSEEEEKEEGIEEEPLCTDDDDNDQSADELFETDNVVVCQYDKIHRCKTKWKFTLKTGIMNLNGKDQVFQKAIGEAEW